MDSNNGTDITRGKSESSRTGSGARAGGAAGILLLAGAIMGWTAAESGSSSAVAAAPLSPASAAGRTIGAASDSYAELVEHVAPAVVTIRAERPVRPASQALPEDHPFREFFGDRFGFGPEAPERREGGLGSGVIVRADGYILTNHHVVERAEQVTVELTDGRSFRAEVVGTDAPSDLAVLKIDGTNLQTLALGNSDQVRVGDVVLAVGNPLGVGQTVTMGIVSATGRATRGAGAGSFEDFIQTDAAINRGNSGGALVSTQGELIGINSQIMSPSGGNIGIGFAIPANMARNVLDQLIESGEVRRGMLGVTIQPVTSDIARSLGLASVRGALVNSVQTGGAAERGGVARGDVIIALDGEAVRDGNDLRNQIAQIMPGSQVALTVVRSGTERTIEVTLSELQASSSGPGRRGPSEDPTGFGLSVEPLTGERAAQLGVQAATGVLVTGVQPAGRAARAGIRAGDVIEEVDGTPVPSVDALRNALRGGDTPALLLVHRGETSLFVTIERGDP